MIIVECASCCCACEMQAEKALLNEGGCWIMRFLRHPERDVRAAAGARWRAAHAAGLINVGGKVFAASFSVLTGNECKKINWDLNRSYFFDVVNYQGGTTHQYKSSQVTRRV